MSVLIKGINMPKSCKECACRETDAFSYDLSWCCLNQADIADKNILSPNCPLVEVHDNQFITKAHWITDDFTKIIKCSECDGEAPISLTSGEQFESNYCPFCGKEMEI